MKLCKILNLGLVQTHCKHTRYLMIIAFLQKGRCILWSFGGDTVKGLKAREITMGKSLAHNLQRPQSQSPSFLWFQQFPSSITAPSQQHTSLIHQKEAVVSWVPSASILRCAY